MSVCVCGKGESVPRSGVVCSASGGLDFGAIFTWPGGASRCDNNRSGSRKLLPSSDTEPDSFRPGSLGGDKIRHRAATASVAQSRATETHLLHSTRERRQRRRRHHGVDGV